MNPTIAPRADRRVSVRGAVAAACLAVVVGAGGVGCSSGASVGSTAATTTTTAPVDTLAPPTVEAASSVTVEAQDNLFSPQHVQVKAGTKVTFVNNGRNQHDVTATDPSTLDFTIPQEKFNPGEKATFTFDKPGTYAYYCSLHASATGGTMRGVITVTP